MDADLVLRVLDVGGVFVFALSGGLAAARHGMDLFGIIVVAFLPAIGGGTLRDLLLDQPVFWLSDTSSLAVALCGGVAAFLAPRFWARFTALVWIDAVGLALFAMVGASKALALGHGFAVTVIMGTITATAGGLIRDVVCDDEALLLREDIYATAALAGGAVFWGVSTVISAPGGPSAWALLAGAGAVFVIRALAIRFKLSLPKPR